MTVLVDWQIRKLCEEGMVDPFDPALVNPASLDIRIGSAPLLVAAKLANTDWLELPLSSYTKEYPFLLAPDEFVLVPSLETINIPTFLCAQFRLKSSRGREGYEHLEAGFCDPGWSGSHLTMEIKNFHPFKNLPLYPGLRIGQLVFSRLDAEPEQHYGLTGRYNNDKGAQQSKG